MMALKNSTRKTKQNWLIHIVGKQKEIRDKESVCILLVPINQVKQEDVVIDKVLDIVVSIVDIDVLISMLCTYTSGGNRRSESVHVPHDISTNRTHEFGHF